MSLLAFHMCVTKLDQNRIRSRVYKIMLNDFDTYHEHLYNTNMELRHIKFYILNQLYNVALRYDWYPTKI